jgi:hypothetical protein
MIVSLGNEPVSANADSRVTHGLYYLLILAALLAVCQFSIKQAWGQTEQAGITGTITDSSGAAVPEAQITATNASTGVSAAAKTNTLGYYNLPYLPIGTYNLKVEKSGFKAGVVSGIALRVNLIATVNVRLEVGTIQEQVSAEATTVLLEQQQAALGQTLADGSDSAVAELGPRSLLVRQVSAWRTP